MEEIKHEKCTTCKCWRIPNDFLNATGRKLKTCVQCRTRDVAYRSAIKCEHNRQKSQCKECGGSQICEHNKRKSQCKECGGVSICEHNRERSKCKECGGVGICEHNRQKSRCKECDPKGHLSTIVSSSVRAALKSDKSKPSIEYLGCSIEDFRKHIEDQFREGMTWDNYGEWHIDHIIPIKYESPTLEEVVERLNYKNTQPLWAAENLAKGNRYIG